MFLEVTEKYKYRGICKQVRCEFIREELLFMMLNNFLKDWLCYLPRESGTDEIFLVNKHGAHGLDLIWALLYVINL